MLVKPFKRRYPPICSGNVKSSALVKLLKSREPPILVLDKSKPLALVKPSNQRSPPMCFGNVKSSALVKPLK